MLNEWLKFHWWIYQIPIKNDSKNQRKKVKIIKEKLLSLYHRYTKNRKSIVTDIVFIFGFISVLSFINYFLNFLPLHFFLPVVGCILIICLIIYRYTKNKLIQTILTFIIVFIGIVGNGLILKKVYFPPVCSLSDSESIALFTFYNFANSKLKAQTSGQDSTSEYEDNILVSSDIDVKLKVLIINLNSNATLGEGILISTYFFKSIKTFEAIKIFLTQKIDKENTKKIFIYHVCSLSKSQKEELQKLVQASIVFRGYEYAEEQMQNLKREGIYL